jgi:hypothetical protein
MMDLNTLRKSSSLKILAGEVRPTASYPGAIYPIHYHFLSGWRDLLFTD